MENLSKALKSMSLGKTSSSTNLEYILTPDEEEAIIRNAIISEMKTERWRLADKGCLPGQIDEKISAIDWENRIDKESVLRICNKNKHYAIRQEADRKKRIEGNMRKRKELKDRCNADFFHSMMRANSLNQKGKFIEDENTTPLIKTICYFMSGDERLKTELNLNPRKGLLLRGTCGLGKTYLFELVSRNPLVPVNLVSMIEIAENIQMSGMYRPKMSGILYLDDLGSENHVINFYGTRINWFKDFFEKFYLRSKHYNRLVASTNCSFDELEEKYGYRFRSRLKEVFNIVNVTGEDLRN